MADFRSPIDRHAVDFDAEFPTPRVEIIKVADLSIGLFQRLPLIIPEVQHCDFTGEIFRIDRRPIQTCEREPWSGLSKETLLERRHIADAPLL